MELHTKLLAMDNKTELQRCTFCNCILTPSFNSLEKQPIVQTYDPEDKESPFSLYCQILKNKTSQLEPIKKIADQIDRIHADFKLTQDFESADRISSLINTVEQTIKQSEAGQSQ